ncbi:MAG: helix-turn-helix transcriptional regulator [Bacilli bacterium]|nr:helix-turn-helix transcriptional regulator [Bacilli bacterium]
MEDLNKIFANNLIKLRRSKNLTQLELANELNYSDRNISKWETAQALPTTEVMVVLAKFFDVTIDFLLQEHTDAEFTLKKKEKRTSLRDRLIIFGLAGVCAYLLATIAFVVTPTFWHASWLSFVYAVPVCSVLAIIFISIWFKKFPYLFIAVSVLIWSILASIYLTILTIAGLNAWPIFLIGIPLEVATIFFSQFSGFHKKKK